MLRCLKKMRTAMRYWLFPESRHIDERTQQFDQEAAEIRRRREEVDRLVKKTNQADVLRNLVINMSNDRRTRI